jgi:hypothetical protein
MVKAAFNKKKTVFTGKLGLILKNRQLKCYTWSRAFHGAEIFGHFRKEIRYTLKVWKTCAGEGWSRSFGPIV